MIEPTDCHDDQQAREDAAADAWAATNPWGERASSDPWSVLGEALVMTSNGTSVPAHLEEAVQMAAHLLVAAALTNAGLSIDSVIKLFSDRDHTIHLSYDKATDAMGLDIRWDDGEVTSLAQEEA